MADTTEPNSKKQKGKRGLEPEGAALASDATQIESQADCQADLPREPETEKGRLVREQYLTFAQAALGDSTLSYLDLYRRYAQESAEVRQAAQLLDQAVAERAFQAGQGPRQVIQLLAQGPFTQYQTSRLSSEEKKAALPQLLQYAQATVGAVQQQRFVNYASAATGKVWNYPDLYRAHIGSDLAAIQLDQKVAAVALQAGESSESVAALLQQGPYARFQRDVKQVKPALLEQYARGTVAQVQEIQALRPIQQGRSQPRSQSLEQ